MHELEIFKANGITGEKKKTIVKNKMMERFKPHRSISIKDNKLKFNPLDHTLSTDGNSCV